MKWHAGVAGNGVVTLTVASRKPKLQQVYCKQLCMKASDKLHILITVIQNARYLQIVVLLLFNICFIIHLKSHVETLVVYRKHPVFLNAVKLQFKSLSLVLFVYSTLFATNVASHFFKCMFKKNYIYQGQERHRQILRFI